MIDYLFFPYPRELIRFLKYSPDEIVPVWVNMCSKKNSLFYSDLFDENLKFKELDKASIRALNEFAFDILEYEPLYQELLFKDIDIDLNIFIEHQPTVNAFNRHGIKTVMDINNYGLVNVKKLDGIGQKKLLYSICEILHKTKSMMEDVKAQEKKDNLSEEEILKLVDDVSEVIKLDRIFINDPRFIAVYLEFAHLINLQTIENPSWGDFFFYGNLTEDKKQLLNSIKKFVILYEKYDDLSLSKQMEEFFVSFIYMNKTGKGVIQKKLHEALFKIADRIGIKEGLELIPTLQETADMQNPPVSRERIRQLESKLKKALTQIQNDEVIYIPKLESIKEILSKNLFCKINDIQTIIASNGYGTWNIERLIHCLNLFRYNHNFVVYDDILTKKDIVSSTNDILKLFKKINSYNGAVNIQHLMHALELEEIDISEKDLENILNSKTERINEYWFYYPNTNNVLFNLTQKIGNFSSKFSVQSVKDALIKYAKIRAKQFSKSYTYFYDYKIPPIGVLARVLDSNEHFRVIENEVEIVKLNNSFLDNDSADYEFLTYFQARNFDCANIDEMKKYFCVEKRMPEGSFLQHITYKPYIKRFAKSIYGIIGHEPDTQSIDNASERITKKTAPIIEWGENGNIEVKVKLNSVQNFACILGDYSEYLPAEEYKIFHKGEYYCGLKKSGFYWYGIAKYLSNILFCEIGDYILINIDVTNEKLTVELISEDEFNHD